MVEQMTRRMARAWPLLVACAVVAGAVSASSPVSAERAEGVVQVSLEVAETGREGQPLGRKTRAEIADRAVPRLKARLRAARIKHVVVQARDAGSIFVEAGGGLSRQALLGLLVPPGAFQLRRVVKSGRDWQTYSPGAPEGVELRQPSGSMKPEEAFVWSERRSRIEEVARKAQLEGVTVFAYPHSGGWRTLSLSDPILETDAIGGAEIRPGTTGEPFVSASLAKRPDTQLHLQARHRGTRWAVVLDGEVVAMLEHTPGATGDLNIPAPDHLSGQQAQMQWARQVAARLAAPMPPRLVPLGNKSDEEK